jgi:hypothetical protein
MTLEGWWKKPGAERPVALEHIRFRVSDDCHLLLEQVADGLVRNQEREALLNIDINELELEMPATCGPLEDCQLRVYISPWDERSHFHLVGHRAADHSLVYSNAVMVDQLG